MKLRYRKILTVLLIISGLIPLGYLSAFLSLHACECHVARWIAYDLFEGQQFYVLTPEEDDHPALQLSGRSDEIFSEIGANFIVYQKGSEQFSGFPWGDVNPAKIRFPFIVTVRFGYVGAPLDGEGGSRIYLCLFGIVIPFGYIGGWVT